MVRVQVRAGITVRVGVRVRVRVRVGVRVRVRVRLGLGSGSGLGLGRVRVDLVVGQQRAAGLELVLVDEGEDVDVVLGADGGGDDGVVVVHLRGRGTSLSPRRGREARREGPQKGSGGGGGGGSSSSSSRAARTISSSVATPSGVPRMPSTFVRSCCADSSCGLTCGDTRATVAVAKRGRQRKRQAATRGRRWRRSPAGASVPIRLAAVTGGGWPTARLLLPRGELLFHQEVILDALELEQPQLALGRRHHGRQPAARCRTRLLALLAPHASRRRSLVLLGLLGLLLLRVVAGALAAALLPAHRACRETGGLLVRRDEREAGSGRGAKTHPQRGCGW